MIRLVADAISEEAHAPPCDEGVHSSNDVIANEQTRAALATIRLS